MEEPGVDRYEWESQWQALEPLLEESPGEALPAVDELVARMMEARGVPLEERAGEELAEHETTREFAEARRTARLLDAGERVDPGEVGHAVQVYRSLYDQLRGFGPERGSPV